MQEARFRFTSPLGVLTYDWNGRECVRLRLTDDAGAKPAGDDPMHRWLQAYFNGAEETLPPLGAPRTPFQAKLRKALLTIPRGKTITYGELARRLHSGPRAVGRGLAANPLPLVIPCHRIVAAGGLGGFSCGIEWKKRLLAFERAS